MDTTRRKVVKGISATAALAPFSVGRLSAQTKTNMAVAYTGPDLQYLTMQVAQQNKFFDEVGLDVEVINLGSGPRVRQAVAAGQAAVGFTSAIDCLMLTLAGRPSKLILGVDRRMAWANVVVRKEDMDSGKLKSVKDMTGGVFAVTQPKSASWGTAAYLMDRAGAKNFQIQGLGDNANCIAALKSKRADAVLLSVLLMGPLIKEGWSGMLFSSSNEAAWNEIIGGDAPGVACFALQKLIDENPDLVQRFVNAMTKAKDFIMKSDNAALANLVFAEFYQNYDRQVFDPALAHFKSYIYSADNLVTEQAYERMKKLMVLGDLEKEETLAKPEASYANFADFTFVRKARGG